MSDITDLLTLDKKTLEPPESRVADKEKGIMGVRSRIYELKEGDRIRSRRRAFIMALLDGEPPYDSDEMEECGRGDDANINFRRGEGRVAAATAPYYELTFGGPCAIDFDLYYEETPKQKCYEWAQCIARRFTEMLWGWKGYKDNMMMAHYQMVVFGHGPCIWKNKKGWHFLAKRDDSVWVADNARCDLGMLSEMAMPGHFEPVELWNMVKNAPKDSGWNVDMAKYAIIAAAPKTFRDTYHHAWSQYEASLRRGDIMWENKAARIYYTDYLVREFDDKITHCIVLETQPDQNDKENPVKDDFVFKKVGRFGSFHEIICPFHFDVGPDGYWWSVKGLGPKIYDASDLENRFLCTLINGAMASAGAWLQAKNGTATQSIMETPIVRASGVNFIPDTWQMITQPVQSRMDGSLAVMQAIQGIVDSNTGSYNQLDTPPQPTMGQEEYVIAGRGVLTRTAHDRYYQFADDLVQEIFRRALDKGINNDDDGGEEAKEFRRKLIEEDQVPEEVLDFKNFCNIRAYRVIGLGSPQMQQIISKNLFGMIGTMDEESRQNALRFIGSGMVGYGNVDRFWKKFEDLGIPNDQEAMAQLENNQLRLPGTKLIVSPGMNHAVHLTSHFKYAFAGVQAIQQGAADPQQVITLLDNTGPHTHEHLDKLKGDATRKNEYKLLVKVQAQLGKITDQLKKQVEKIQASGQPGKPQVDTDQAEGMMKMLGDQKLKEAKLLMDEKRKDRKTEADMRRKDMVTAANIYRRNAETIGNGSRL